LSEFGYWEYAGKNGLLGVANTEEELSDGRILTVKDPDNPAVLQDKFILYILRTSRQGRADFSRLFPILDSDSQDRLTTLILSNPRASSLLLNEQDFADAVQHKNVTTGVRTRLGIPSRGE
jgi:hypothetical protein